MKSYSQMSVDEAAEAGYPRSQGWVAARDGQPRSSNPRRGKARGVWDRGYDSFKQRNI